MIGQILLAENEAIYSAFAFAVLCVSVAAYSVVRERHKKQQTQIEAEFKREMVFWFSVIWKNRLGWVSGKKASG